MKTRQWTALRSAIVAATVFCGAAANAQQVDLQATRAYLRTGVNAGSEVTTPALGQQVYVHVDYKVVGGTDSFDAVVRALIDGVEHCSGTLTFAPDTDQVIWCPAAVTAAAGSHTLRWVLDSQGQVAESNENNNAVEFTFTTGAAGSRDLEAARAFLRTQANGGTEIASPALGQQVFFHFDYRVGGSGANFMADVAATLDGQPFCSGPITFTPGIDGTVWCPGAWTATAGMHTLRWRIDSSNTVTETDEGNNETQVVFTTGGTTSLDIEAERAFLRTEVNGGEEITDPDVAQTVFFHVDYGVTGATGDVTADVSAFIDDEEHCGGDVNLGTEPGTVWCNNAWIATAGTHTLRWTINGDHAIDESDDNNNSVVTTFIVGGTGQCVGDCDDNGNVVVNELVLGVNIALDRGHIEDCPAFDRDLSGTVAVNELVSGVDNLLRGCR